MFERFTRSAREVVVRAQVEARRLGHPRIGTEHVLLALTGGGPNDPATAALADAGIDEARITAALTQLVGEDALDAAALESVGIDLTEVRRRVEAEFGPGALEESGPKPSRRIKHLPFTDDAKRTLELSLRETVALHDREITSGHILLGLLHGDLGLGYRIVENLGVDIGLLRTRLGARMRTSA